MKKRKYLAIAALLCCSLLAACGGGDSSSGDSSTSSGDPVSSESGSQDSGHEEISSSPVTAFYVNVDYNPNNVSVGIMGEQDEYGRYEAGTRITISATLINTDYTLMDISSEDVTFTSKEVDDARGTVTFVMPSNNVTIDVTAESADKTRIEEINNYSSSYVSGFSISEGDEYNVGSRVSYSFNSSYYTTESGAKGSVSSYYVTVNGKTYNPYSADWENASSTTYYGSFEMPEENAVIEIVFASTTLADSGFTASFENDEYVRCLSIADVTQTYSVNSSIYVVIRKEAGVNITGLSCSTDGGTTFTEIGSLSGTYTMYGNTNSDIVYISLYASAYFSAGQNVIFKANYLSNISYYNLEFVNADDIVVSSGSYSSHPMAGDSISIRYSGAEGKYVSGSATVVTDDGTEVSTTANTTSFLSFTMPSKNVTVTFNVNDQLPVDAKQSDTLSTQIIVKTSLYTTESVNFVTPGQSYYVCALAADGYILDGFDINGTRYSDVSTNTSTTYGGPYSYVRYSVPSDATEMKISTVVSTGYVASTDISSECASVTFGTGFTSTFSAGDSVSFTVAPTAYYSIDDGSVKLADENGNNVSISNLQTSSDGVVTGTFTMPAANVTLSASFTKKSTRSISVSLEGNASSYVQSLSVQGTTSGASLTNTSSSAEFIVGETVSIYVYYSDFSYDYTVCALSGSSKTELVASSVTSTYTYLEYAITDSLDSFAISVSKKQYLNVSYDIESGLTMTYAYSESQVSLESAVTKVSNFDNRIYSGYYCYFQVSGIPSRYSAVVSVKDSNGREIEVSTAYLYDEDYENRTEWYRFIPTSDFTISVSTRAQLTIGVELESGISSGIFDIINDSNGDYLKTGTNYVDYGSSLRIAYYSESPLLYYYVDYEDASYTDISGSLPNDNGSRFTTFTVYSDATIRLTSSPYEG